MSRRSFIDLIIVGICFIMINIADAIEVILFGKDWRNERDT